MHISRYWDGTGEPGISSEGDGFDNRRIAINDNGVALADATIAQLTDAIRRKVGTEPSDQRESAAELAVALLAYKLLGRSLSYARARS